MPGTDSESMLMALDLRGVACSAGSACQSGSIARRTCSAAIGVAADLASVGDSHEPRRADARTHASIAWSELFPTLVEKARRLATGVIA